MIEQVPENDDADTEERGAACTGQSQNLMGRLLKDAESLVDTLCRDNSKSLHTEHAAGTNRRVRLRSLCQCKCGTGFSLLTECCQCSSAFPGAPACWKAAHSAKNEKALLIDLLS